MTADDGALVRAQALGEPSRFQIHRLLGEAAAPMTVAEIAAATGLHRTAVGQHLAKLRAAGLVVEERLAPAGRGRPPTAFRAVPAPPDRHYLDLASMLAEAVRTGRSALDTGRAIGARSVEVAGPGGDPVAALTAEADRLGFEPRARRRRGGAVDVVLARCPFAELAAVDPDTICDLHLGLAQGLATAHRGMVVEALDVADPHQGGCRFSVRVDRRR